MVPAKASAGAAQARGAYLVTSSAATTVMRNAERK